MLICVYCIGQCRSKLHILLSKLETSTFRLAEKPNLTWPVIKVLVGDLHFCVSSYGIYAKL